MCNTRIFVIASLLVFSACAHREAVRVDCEGTLRPINRAPSNEVKGGKANTESSTSDHGTNETPHGRG